MYLGHIASMLSNRNFNAPMLIHDTNPPGVATMIRSKSKILYTLSDAPQGEKTRIETSNPEPPTRYTHSRCFKSSTIKQSYCPQLSTIVL